MINISPLTTSCAKSFQNKEHICFGISPFNSLFTQEYLESLVAYGSLNFKSFHFFLPDEPTIYTLEAMGYGSDEARKKMKKQINWLRNKIQKALETRHLALETHLLDWKYLISKESFRQELDEVYGLFDSNEEFRKSCLESSRWVLKNKIEETLITDKTLFLAVKYFLSEIPLFACTNKIVGTDSSLFCYHQAIIFHDQLYANHLAYKSSSGQGYGIIA